MEISRNMVNKRIFLTIIIGVLFCVKSIGQERLSKGIKFEVVSVRILSGKELLKRDSDMIGADISVKLKLSAGDKMLEFFTADQIAVPIGYKVLVDKGSIFWLYQGKKLQSPGLNGLSFTKGSGKWLLLPDGASIEWEEIDYSLNYDKKHAFTIFIKDKGKIHEIISDTYNIPTTK
jgi:hypothetical protein